MIVISVVVPFVLFVLCTGASLLLALKRNAELELSAPDVLPYTWGFFLGYSGIIVAVIAVLATLVAAMAGYYKGWFPLVVLYAVASGIASYGVLIRRRWGWVLHIPLSMNMGLWAFNSVYAHNRWREIPWR
jgi:hypothetical protein